jgi:MFS family permease
VFSALAAGALVTKLGRYWPFLILCSIVTSVGAGLFLLLAVDASPAKWIVSQLVFGFGIGLGWQQGSIVAQTVLELRDTPIGIAQLFVAQVFGAAVIVAIAQVVFAKNLTHNILVLGLKGIDASTILRAGATEIGGLVGPVMMPRLLEAYNAALLETFKVALVAACLSLIGSLTLERLNIREK